MLGLDGEVDRESVAEHLAEEAAAEVIGVTRPDALGAIAVDELPEDGVDPIAKAAEQVRPRRLRGPGWPSGMGRGAGGPAAQFVRQARCVVVAVTEQPAAMPSARAGTAASSETLAAASRTRPIRTASTPARGRGSRRRSGGPACPCHTPPRRGTVGSGGRERTGRPGSGKLSISAKSARAAPAGGSAATAAP